MTILCERCRREVEGDISIPATVEDVDLSALPFVPLSEYRHLPNVGGVYFATSGDRVCYIGAANNLFARWRNHQSLYRFFQEKDPRIVWIVVNNRQQRHALEQSCIKRFKPLWNVGGAEHLRPAVVMFRFPSKAQRERWESCARGTTVGDVPFPGDVSGNKRGIEIERHSAA